MPSRLLSSEKIAKGVAEDGNEFPVVAWAAIALTEQPSVSDAAFTKGRWFITINDGGGSKVYTTHLRLVLFGATTTLMPG